MLSQYWAVAGPALQPLVQPKVFHGGGGGGGGHPYSGRHHDAGDRHSEYIGAWSLLGQSWVHWNNIKAILVTRRGVCAGEAVIRNNADSVV